MRQTTKDQYTRQSAIIQRLLHETAEEYGAMSGFVQRRSKMTAEVFVQVLVLGLLENREATLNDLVQISAQLGVEISEPGLHGRINELAVVLLAQVLASSLKYQAGGGAVPAGIAQRFAHIDIVDSTQIRLPKALAEHFAGHNSPGTEAMLKMHLSIDYLSGRLNAVRIEAGRTPDQRCDLAVQQAQPGSLQLFDMGYVVLKYLREIDAREAYFLTPFKTSMHVYTQADAAKAVDLGTWLDERAAEKGYVDEWVFIGAEERLPVRLVAFRLSEKQAAERRRRSKENARKKGRTVSQRHLRLLDWGIWITNAPADLLPPQAVPTLYRVRWQIELFFKLCKSQFGLAQVGHWRLPRVLSYLYARLIGIVLFQSMIVPWRFHAGRELSPTKAFRIVRRRALAVLQAVHTRGDELAAILADIQSDFLRFALKTPRKKSPSTFARLLELDALFGLA